MTETTDKKPPLNGRRALPSNNSNDEENEVPEMEAFGLIPRGFNPKDYLRVVSIHMFKDPHEINKQQHHTDKYYNPKLIVRRGQPFQIQIDFNRPYRPETDQFWLEYLIGTGLEKAMTLLEKEKKKRQSGASRYAPKMAPLDAAPYITALGKPQLCLE